MYLSRLHITQFKNIAQASLHLASGINVFHGNNGEGKTNLLDALHYLSLCKSFVNLRDADSVRYGQPEATLFGEYVFADGSTERISCLLCAGADKGGKQFKRNGKAYDKLSAHIGLLPLVMVAPADTFLVSEGGEARRRFMDTFLSQTDPAYMEALQQVRKLLAQRNLLLKQEQPAYDLLQVLDMQLSRRSQVVFEKRAAFCAQLTPLLGKYYGLLSQDKEQVSLHYRSDLAQDSMENLLLQYADRDRRFQFTTLGVQRDDLLFDMDGRPLKYAGSQGQQKSFLVALKLAQFSLLKERKGFPPLLLLDDVFDKLDLGRVENLLHTVVSQDFGQIFITDSNKNRVRSLVDSLDKASDFYEVRGGVFTV